MRLLITGASGMLGATLVQKFSNKFDVFATSRKNFKGNPAKNFLEFDLIENSYSKLIEWSKPNVIIHCAAITDLDYSELNKNTVYAINSES